MMGEKEENQTSAEVSVQSHVMAFAAVIKSSNDSQTYMLKKRSCQENEMEQ